MFSLGYVVDFRFITLIKRLARYLVLGTRYSVFGTLGCIGNVSIINDIYGYLKYLFGFLPFYGRALKSSKRKEKPNFMTTFENVHKN